MDSVNTGKQMKDNGIFKVMTFNLKCEGRPDRMNSWNHRKQRVMDFIDSINPDILGTQELSPHMKEDVKSSLLSYSIFGWGRKRNLQGEHSDILVNNGEVTVLDSKTFWLSRTPEIPGSKSFFTPFPRVCTMAEVYMKRFDRRVRIFNTHLDHIYPFMRTRGILTILKYINDYDERERLPVVLMGDFNASPASMTLKMLKAGLHSYTNIKLRDVYAFCKKNYIVTNTFHSFKGKVNKRLLDYIFVSEELDIHNVVVDKTNDNGLYLSDHYPVIAELAFR